jgi:hypothetical protein
VPAVALLGVTVITRNDAGAILHLAIHHRPLGGALKCAGLVSHQKANAILFDFGLRPFRKLRLEGVRFTITFRPIVLVAASAATGLRLEYLAGLSSSM